MNNKLLDFWIENNLNVLMTGHAGVGKTSMILEAFARHNLKVAYFSAPTMDPWVDFIGIPKERADGSGLDFVRPPIFQNDEVEAIVFDEFNRANPKVMNAVMELLQFKSINGKKFKNLRMIWGAINPCDDDQTYSVKELDPAQMDRFQIHVTIPYRLNRKYFTDKYGAAPTEALHEWWSGLPDKIQRKVSPRRADYVMSIALAGGDIGYVLPNGANHNDLTTRLAKGSYAALFELIKSDDTRMKKELENSNFQHWIVDNYEKLSDTTVLNANLSSEHLSILLNKYSKNKAVFDVLVNSPNAASTIADIIAAGKNKTLIKKLQKLGIIDTPEPDLDISMWMTTHERKEFKDPAERAQILNNMTHHIATASTTDINDPAQFHWENIGKNVGRLILSFTAKTITQVNSQELDITLKHLTQQRPFGPSATKFLNQWLTCLGLSL